MKDIMEFFTEDNGRRSSMRLMAFECVTAGIIVALVVTFTGKIDLDSIGLVTSLVTLGLTGKAVQKAAEADANPQVKP